VKKLSSPLGLPPVLACLAAYASEPTPHNLPLKPERTLEFTVEEGTWMSLDVARDGRTIVFELLGDLYTLDVGGGDARLLLGGMPFESQPVYSPDGAQIAFLSDRSGSENLWVANADGSNLRQLTKDEDDRTFVSPAWSPDGQYVYVTRSIPSYGIFEIWMYHVRGGSGVQITKANGASPGAGGSIHTHEERAKPVDARPNTMGPAPSPDGRYLYYSLKKGGFEYNAELPLWSIARRDLRTGVEDQVITAPGSAMRPVLSPDGALLVYATRFDGQTGLRLRTLNSGEDRWLAYPVQHDEQEATPSRDLMPGFDFTPDGRALILSYGGKIQRLDIASGATRTIPFKAAVKLEVGPQLRANQTNPTGPVRARIIQTPRQSPDGRTLAFSALGSLYVSALDAEAKPRRLTASTSAEFQPSWSADGRWIAYVTWASAGGHIWKVRSDGGGKPQQLTRTPGYYSDPLFSADGGVVYALRSSRDDRLRAQSEIGLERVADVISIPANGGDAELIAHAAGARGLHSSADPERLYFYTQGGVQSVRLDGADRRTHIQIKGVGQRVFPDPVPARDVRLSPDGKWALAWLSSQLHLVAAPETGAADLSVNLAAPAVPHQRLSRRGADDFAWADGGRTITWSLGAKFYRLPLASVAFDRSPPDPAPAYTAQVDVARDIPDGATVLRGATAITMKGDEVIENADVIVVDDRIAAVAAAGSTPAPPNAVVRDVSGRFITPGFVDTHAHWYEIRRGVLDPTNWSFLATLAYGVTTGLDVQPFTSDMFVYEDLLDAGLALGPRAYSTGPGVFSDNRIGSRQDALDLLSRYRDFYGVRNLKSYVIGNRRERQLIVDAARELGMIPTTEGALDFKLGLTHALDGFAGHEHALPNAPLYDDVVQLFARMGIGYTIASLAAYGGPFAEDHFYITQSPHDDPKVNRFTPHFVTDEATRRRIWFRASEHIHPQLAAQAAKILRAGGRIGVGSHGQFQGLGYHWELQSLASGGLTPPELLRAATIVGADIIGRSGELGSLEPGKLADLLVLECNPLADIRCSLSLEHVMKNGRLYDADTLAEIAPRQRPAPVLWFNDDRPGGGRP
jgi:Tol biopolymer transport system component